MIRTVTIDDERPSLDRLSRLLDANELTQLMGSFTKPLEALEFLKEHVVDAIFIDIEMPQINGIDLANQILDIQENICIIFVTAYNEYAVEAFRINALDYICKPVSANRLEESIKRIVTIKGVGISSSEVKIHCFGKFSVIKGGGEIKFRTEKAVELLALLIDRRGEYISRSNIIDFLWTDFDGDRAIVHFNTTLHYVKKALRQYGIHLPITFEQGGYKIDLCEVECDYLKFIEFLDKEKKPSKSNILEFEEAVSLYKEEYLSGLDYNWVAIKRLFLEDQFMELILIIARFYNKNNNVQKGIQWLKKGLSINPIHRDINYLLIKLLIKAKEDAVAKKYYEVYSDSLQKKVECQPDKAFFQLFEYRGYKMKE